MEKCLILKELLCQSNFSVIQQYGSKWEEGGSGSRAGDKDAKIHVSCVFILRLKK